jgi:hypothetical protein
MRLRPALWVAACLAVGLLLAALPLRLGYATALRPVPAANYLRSPQSHGSANLAVPVAGRTALSPQHSHRATSQHTRQARRGSRQAQQYYQPARQYYQWNQR